MTKVEFPNQMTLEVFNRKKRTLTIQFSSKVDFCDMSVQNNYILKIQCLNIVTFIFDKSSEEKISRAIRFVTWQNLTLKFKYLNLQQLPKNRSNSIKSPRDMSSAGKLAKFKQRHPASRRCNRSGFF